MDFIAVINKYSRDIKYNKTSLYHYCEEHKKELEDLNIRFKVKSEMELFNMEILLRALDVKEAIEGQISFIYCPACWFFESVLCVLYKPGYIYKIIF